MSDLETIRLTLEKAARRRRWAKAWNGLFRGLLLASALWLAAVATFKLFPIPFASLGVAGIAALLLTLGGFVFGGRRKDSALETAQWMDQKLGSKERLSAAIEFSSSSSWGEVLLREEAKRGADKKQKNRPAGGLGKRIAPNSLRLPGTHASSSVPKQNFAPRT